MTVLKKEEEKKVFQQWVKYKIKCFLIRLFSLLTVYLLSVVLFLYLVILSRFIIAYAGLSWISDNQNFLHMAQSEETSIFDKVISISLPKLPFFQHEQLSQWIVVVVLWPAGISLRSSLTLCLVCNHDLQLSDAVAFTFLFLLHLYLFMECHFSDELV